MNSDFFLPVVRECMEHLHEHGITRADVIQMYGTPHFAGFRLWFRNRFMDGPDAPLRDFMWDPAKTCDLFIRLIVKHWDSTEDEWREIIRQTKGLSRVREYFGPSQPILGPDQFL